MGVYTFEISGEAIGSAQATLEAADGVRVRSAPGEGRIVVTADAPTVEDAQSLVQAALPGAGTYAVGRPAPLEDEDD